MPDITKEEFEAFVKVQTSGMYNMFDPEAIRETGLDKDTYLAVMKNYSELEEKYKEDDDVAE